MSKLEEQLKRKHESQKRRSAHEELIEDLSNEPTPSKKKEDEDVKVNVDEKVEVKVDEKVNLNDNDDIVVNINRYKNEVLQESEKFHDKYERDTVYIDRKIKKALDKIGKLKKGEKTKIINTALREYFAKFK